jgi:hypothetical protein
MRHTAAVTQFFCVTNKVTQQQGLMLAEVCLQLRTAAAIADMLISAWAIASLADLILWVFRVDWVTVTGHRPCMGCSNLHPASCCVVYLLFFGILVVAVAVF